LPHPAAWLFLFFKEVAGSQYVPQGAISLSFILSAPAAVDDIIISYGLNLFRKLTIKAEAYLEPQEWIRHLQITLFLVHKDFSVKYNSCTYVKSKSLRDETEWTKM